MKTSEGRIGRIFVIRLENGDRMPQSVEEYALKKKIYRGLCFLIGGINKGSKIVTGPKNPCCLPVIPIFTTLENVHEISGVGTIFPDKEGKPKLHMHASFGRKKKSLTGCIRPGIEVWNLGEVIILEILKNKSKRIKDEKTGFEVLEVV